MIRVDRHTINNLKEVGLTTHQIAWTMGVCKRTVQRWVASEPLKQSAVRGRPCKIMPLPARWILSQLRENPYLTQEDIANVVKSRQLSTLRYTGLAFPVFLNFRPGLKRCLIPPIYSGTKRLPINGYRPLKCLKHMAK